MSQSVRQSELFAGQDWRVLYRAFTQINFNASDPVSINKALREYILANYPEDFSDWIESSEFIAIIDLLSYLAGNLAFKSDINARENFLETAEARESILRLARFLSYNPRRNRPARGVMKLQSIQTDDDVFDAFGNNLANQTIIWNDPNDPDWFEKFVLILNNAFTGTNPFGIPLKTGSLAGVRTQLYRINTRMGNIDAGFDANVSNETVGFEYINLDFDETTGFTERAPDPDAAFHIAYRSDGNGNASGNTGFFVGFKQGELRNRLYDIANQSENLVIDIPDTGINQTDVWVQSVTDAGEVISEWTPVPVMISDNVTGYNVTFNTIPAEVRDIYQAITRDNDAISIRFGDGRFGSAPIGNLRVWFRVSNGAQYQIQPQEMTGIPFSVSFTNRRNVPKILNMTFSLEETVSNAAARETDDEIRRRAPQVYATQNRMVSGEDYNTFPLSSNNAKKIKAVSRVYSGQSRFIDLADPTGTYQDVTVFGDDGIFYSEGNPIYAEVPITDNRTPDELISLYILPTLARQEMVNFMVDYILRQSMGGFVPVPDDMAWVKVSGTTGYFTQTSPYINVGASFLMTDGTRSRWVGIADIDGTPTTPPLVGEVAPVTLSAEIPSGWEVSMILPRYATGLTDEVTSLVRSRLQATLSFTLWYDYTLPSTPWSVRTPSSLAEEPITVGTAMKALSAEYLAGGVWRFSGQGMRYLFESVEQVEFYFDGQQTTDTNNARQDDLIRVLRINEDLNNGGVPLGTDIDFPIYKMVVAPDGYADPKRVTIRLPDADKDGVIDLPDSYLRIVSSVATDTYLFWQREDSGDWLAIYGVQVFDTESQRRGTSTLPINTVAFQVGGAQPQSFWLMTETGWVYQPFGFRHARGRGPNVAANYLRFDGVNVTPTPSSLYYQWKHYAPSDRRIDPARSNIIDMFVLTAEYDFLVRQWIANGADPETMPKAPSEFDLRTTFNEFETFKMFSDEMVWRPVRYKYLFGANADASLRAQFKVVKLPTASISDGEIKSRIIRAIDNYFSVEFWDFGETFYFTEMAAYVHQQLAGIVSSIVIVPLSQSATFGDGFEVKCRSDELFISTAQVTDVLIIDSNTPANLRYY